MLRIVVEQSMDSAVVRCSGRLVAGKAVLRLREAVMCLADKRIVQLDLAGVEAIDAAGLGLLISLHTLGQVVGFKLQVRNPVRRVGELLKLTRLESVLDIPLPGETAVHSSAGPAGNDRWLRL
ncbi:MAG TPA: STAS domain-containing protein [Terriglobales bacterium]|nr:STAS domain-containing protein [Terriglobales bacterium]